MLEKIFLQDSMFTLSTSAVRDESAHTSASEPKTFTILRSRAKPYDVPAEGALEALLRPLHIHCIASGVVGGVTKQYYYAVASDHAGRTGDSLQGGLFAVEISVTAATRHLSALIKGPTGGSANSRFAHIVQQRLRALFV